LVNGINIPIILKKFADKLTEAEMSTEPSRRRIYRNTEIVRPLGDAPQSLNSLEVSTIQNSNTSFLRYLIQNDELPFNQIPQNLNIIGDGMNDLNFPNLLEIVSINSQNLNFLYTPQINFEAENLNELFPNENSEHLDTAFLNALQGSLNETRAIPPTPPVGANDQQADTLKIDRDKIDDRFLCQITNEVMTDPVYVDGLPQYVYERAQIVHWMKIKKGPQPGESLHPAVRTKTFTEGDLIPLTPLKYEINAYLAAEAFLKAPTGASFLPQFNNNQPTLRVSIIPEAQAILDRNACSKRQAP
jgi:hypothetical protein